MEAAGRKARTAAGSCAVTIAINGAGSGLISETQRPQDWEPLS